MLKSWLDSLYRSPCTKGGLISTRFKYELLHSLKFPIFFEICPALILKLRRRFSTFFSPSSSSDHVSIWELGRISSSYEAPFVVSIDVVAVINLDRASNPEEERGGEEQEK